MYKTPYNIYEEPLEEIADTLKSINLTLIELNNSLCDVVDAINKKK